MREVDLGIHWGLRDGIELVDLFSGSNSVILMIGVLQGILSIIAIVDIVKHKKFKCGNMVLWILLVVFIQFVGPVLYFAIGREEL